MLARAKVLSSCLLNSTERDMEAALLQSGSQSPESGEWEPVEKYMMEMVKKRRIKVQRLEQELDALRDHCAKLFESFSVPTFPEGTLLSYTLRLSSVTFIFFSTFSSRAFQ